jgi:hypothetical protein
LVEAAQAAQGEFHDIGSGGGTRYVVQELLEGKH